MKNQPEEMSDILVRPLEERDLVAVAGLLGQLADYAHTSTTPTADHTQKLYAAMHDNPRQYKNLVACMDGIVVGFISIVYYLTFLYTGRTALINELVVSVAHRRSGIGRALVQAAVSQSRQDGLDAIEVGTEKDNGTAIAFYKRVGFDKEYVLVGKDFGD